MTDFELGRKCHEKFCYCCQVTYTKIDAIGNSAHKQKCKHYRAIENVEQEEESEESSKSDDDNDSDYESD